MMKHLLPLLLSCLPLTTEAQTVTYYDNVTLEQLRALSLPLLDIQTVDGQLPGYEESLHPPGAMGRSIKNATKVPSRMTVVVGADTLYDSGAYEADRSGLTIKIRGNTTAYYEQKPYKLKLEKKADPLKRGDDRLKNKHWVLLADPSMRSAVGFTLSQMIGMDWTPAWAFVNLRLNGQYVGLYVLCEQVRRDDSRIAVDKLTGYIIEHDAYWWNEDLYFESDGGRKFTFKYPESEDATPLQVDYIRTVVSAMDAAIADGSYARHLDTPSWARWMLAHDILGTYDSGGTNFFLSKQDNTPRSLLRACVLWDFSSIFRNDGQWSRLHTDSYTYFPSLFANADPSFRQAYVEAWQELSPWLFDDMEQWLAAWTDTKTLQDLQTSRQWMARVFNGTFLPFDTDVASASNWFQRRRTWMTDHIVDIIPTAIPSISSNSRQHGTITPQNSSDTPVYDLQGRRIHPSARGFHVRHGKVIISL